jgi:hypothetical protein
MNARLCTPMCLPTIALSAVRAHTGVIDAKRLIRGGLREEKEQCDTIFSSVFLCVCASADGVPPTHQPHAYVFVQLTSFSCTANGCTTHQFKEVARRAAVGPLLMTNPCIYRMDTNTCTYQIRRVYCATTAERFRAPVFAQ